jgi:hypothetical protein
MNASVKRGPVQIKMTPNKPMETMRVAHLVLKERRITNKIGIEKGDEVHFIIGRTNVAQQWAEALSKEDKQDKTKIPEQYEKFTDVFSEEKAQQFPSARKNDHAIEFKPDTPRTFSYKIYLISTKKTGLLHGWVRENLDKRFIRESKSPYASLTFVIKKKNGDFRVVQNYRRLNEYTIPDVSPLPLIASIIEGLHKRTLFTKFDVQWGYHNIQIKERDQEKAAF